MIRVGVVSPEPTPYRAPMFDRLAREPGLDLTVVYSAETTVRRRWTIALRHRAMFLAGRQLPLSSVLGHDYPVTPSIWPLLSRERFDVVVVAGWSVFASQAAIAWCRLHRTPYVLMSESLSAGRRPLWRRAVKRLVLPHVVRPAAGYLVPGSLASRYLTEYGAHPPAILVFANTIDVEAFAGRVDELRSRRDEFREELGIGPEDVAVLSVARLVAEKDMPTLLDAVAIVARERPVQLVLVGTGPEEARLRRHAAQIGCPAIFAGFRTGDRLTQAYAAADVFALLSVRETWGVVVNEAMAAGLPLVLTSGVGAAADLLRHGENGFLVPVGASDAAANSIAALIDDAALRARLGRRSRELVGPWGYEPSVARFVEAVHTAVSDRARCRARYRAVRGR